MKNQSELSNGNCVPEMSMANEFTNETQLDQNELSTLSMSKGCTDELRKNSVNICKIPVKCQLRTVCL